MMPRNRQAMCAACGILHRRADLKSHWIDGERLLLDPECWDKIESVPDPDFVTADLLEALP